MQGRGFGESPRAVSTARRLGGELGVHSPLRQLREPHRTTLPLLPQKRAKPSPCPLVKIYQHGRSLAEAEITLPSSEIAAQFPGHLLDAHSACPSRQLPNSFSESEDRFGRYAPLRLATQSEAESEKLPLPWPRYRALLLVDLEFQLRRDEPRDTGHHSLPGSPTADVDITVVRVSGESETASL